MHMLRLELIHYQSSAHIKNVTCNPSPYSSYWLQTFPTNSVGLQGSSILRVANLGTEACLSVFAHISASNVPVWRLRSRGQPAIQTRVFKIRIFIIIAVCTENKCMKFAQAAVPSLRLNRTPSRRSCGRRSGRLFRFQLLWWWIQRGCTCPIPWMTSASSSCLHIFTLSFERSKLGMGIVEKLLQLSLNQNFKRMLDSILLKTHNPKVAQKVAA